MADGMARFPAGFDPQPTFSDGVLDLRPLTGNDREGLYIQARDPLVWAGHPARTRHERSVFDPYFDTLLASGGTLAVVEKATGTIIGCSRYYPAPDHDPSVSIGYTFLGRNWWGGGTNRRMKGLMLTHAFAGVAEVWLHIDPTNIRSQTATARLGATHAYDAALVMGGKEGVWQCWKIGRGDWPPAR
jgi:N-acetyltransferase